MPETPPTPPHKAPDPHRALPEPEHARFALPANSGDPAPSEGAPPMPEIPASELDKDFAVRILYEEHKRLRDELDKMRDQQQQKGKDDKGGDDKGGDDKEGGDKKEGDDKEGGDKEEGKDEDKEKKPPFKERATAWVKEHPIATVLSLIGLVLLIIAIALLVHYLNSYENTDDAFLDGHTDQISARVSGTVANVYVENTTRVHKGQLLLVLDQRDAQVSKEQAAASYAQAQAATRAQAPNVPLTANDQTTRIVTQDYDIVSARANVAASEERYRSALADLDQAKANQANAAREEERYRLLVVKEEVSREQYDQRATQERAQAAVVASRREAAAATARSVTQAQAQLGQAEQRARQARQDLPQQLQMQREQLAQRKASELAAKAQADQAELNLQYTRIYAPEDGVIGDKQVQVATQVAPGQELFALTQTNDIWVTANFKETQIKRMHRGQSVTIFVDALGAKFEGYIEGFPGASGAVYSLLPPENATGNYVKVVQRLPVRIRINPNQVGAERLSPGMSVVPKVWLR